MQIGKELTGTEYSFSLNITYNIVYNIVYVLQNQIRQRMALKKRKYANASSSASYVT